MYSKASSDMQARLASSICSHLWWCSTSGGNSRIALRVRSLLLESEEHETTDTTTNSRIFMRGVR
jgi:hypothetical protein